LAPSQPTTHRAEKTCVESSSAVAVTVTRSPSTISTTSCPRSTVMPGSAAALAAISSSRAGWCIVLASGQP
jgi:hypothetical protein